MKRAFCLIQHFFLSLSLIFSTLSLPVISFALDATDTSLDAERTKCASNTAYVWDAARNRCIQKADAQAARHEVEDCAAIVDMEQRKECHKKIAENKTELNADPHSLPEGSGSAGNMAMINAAYTMIGLINGLGTGNKESSCTSKKIFGITAMAGVATDIWLKIKAKKALDTLKDKYQLSVKSNAYDNQTKAFEYLKEEQKTVKEVAGREKTRNMLLMLGYGAASLMAIYEMTPYGQNPDCNKKEQPNKKTPEPEKKPVTAEEPAPAPANKAEAMDCGANGTPTGTGGCTYAVAESGKIESRTLDDNKPTPVKVNPDPSEIKQDTTPKQQYVVEQRNGVTQIKSVDGNTSIIGNRIIDRSGNVIGTVDGNIEIRKVGMDSPISSADYKKYGVYSSSATDSANKINFTNSGTGGRTTVNGSTTTINDSRLKRGK